VQFCALGSNVYHQKLPTEDLGEAHRGDLRRDVVKEFSTLNCLQRAREEGYSRSAFCPFSLKALKCRIQEWQER
jgi:hypothetical protein